MRNRLPLDDGLAADTMARFFGRVCRLRAAPFDYSLRQEPMCAPSPASAKLMVAMSFYLLTREVWHFYAVALLFGFAYGGVIPLYAILVREFFGARIMGTTFGVAGFASTLGTALGPAAGCTMRSAAMPGCSSAFVGLASERWPSRARSARHARCRPRCWRRAWPTERGTWASPTLSPEIHGAGDPRVWSAAR
jgi:MFS family permease